MIRDDNVRITNFDMSSISPHMFFCFMYLFYISGHSSLLLSLFTQAALFNVAPEHLKVT